MHSAYPSSDDPAEESALLDLLEPLHSQLDKFTRLADEAKVKTWQVSSRKWEEDSFENPGSKEV